MNYKECIQHSVNYIEENLKNNFSLQDVADNCFISYFHFSRIFRTTFGIPVFEYIKRRRLSEAAIQLKNPNKNILEIALEYYFDSQETFTRNFKKQFGITPGKYRKSKQKIVLYEKTDFFMELPLINKKGAVTMDIKTVSRDVMKLVGIEKKVNYYNTHEENPKIWEEFIKRYEEIKNKKNPEIYFEVLSETLNNLYFNAFFCVEVNNTNEIPEGMIVRELPASEYLVFTHKGAVVSEKGSLLKETYDFIYGKYIPSSDYEVSGDFSFELCDINRFKGPNDPNSELDIYIPIKSLCND